MTGRRDELEAIIYRAIFSVLDVPPGVRVRAHFVRVRVFFGCMRLLAP